MSQEKQWDTALNLVIAATPSALRPPTTDSSTLPSRLYHFTDTAGLVGILTSKALWATHAGSFSDSSEVQYGIDSARSLLEGGSLAAPDEFTRQVAQSLDVGRLPERVRVLLDVYIVSFCAREDQAVHWSQFGRNGTGVALGLDPNRLTIQGVDLGRVLYGPDEQDRFLGSIVEETSASLIDLARGFPGPEESDRFLKWGRY